MIYLMFDIFLHAIYNSSKVGCLNLTSGKHVRAMNAHFYTVDSSSLTNEKDHHYFLNSADVCW